MDENCMLYRYCCFGRKKKSSGCCIEERRRTVQTEQKIRAENMNRSHLGNA